jgi:hypothetical protein
MNLDLPKALFYMLKARDIQIEGLLYADLNHVYVIRSGALIKVPTENFKVNSDEI